MLLLQGELITERVLSGRAVVGLCGLQAGSLGVRWCDDGWLQRLQHKGEKGWDGWGRSWLWLVVHGMRGRT